MWESADPFPWRCVIAEVYSIADVIRLVGWERPDRKSYTRYYQRAYKAVCGGHAGEVARMGRGCVLSPANVQQLLGYLRGRWPEECPAQPTAAQG
jgi:hypothetical protein